MDGDGDADLAAGNYGSANISVLLNQGSGTFSDDVVYGVASNPYFVSAGDLDGDGDVDLAAANFNADNVAVLLNDGDGTFAPFMLFGVGDAPSSAAIADLDGVGASDLAVANFNSANVSVLLNACGAEICAQPGDMNLDGLIDGDDVQLFVNCLFGVNGTNCICADLDGGGVGPSDVALFVAALLAG